MIHSNNHYTKAPDMGQTQTECDCVKHGNENNDKGVAW